MYEPPVVVAEIGAVHLGSIDRAKELIKLAHFCGSQYVKFQKRNPDECVPEHLKHLPHPNPDFSYGSTYLEHRKNLELTIEQHKYLSDYCNLLGIKYSTSVWDLTSAKEVIEYINPDFIKIPSACNTNYELLNYIFNNYSGDVHVSTGMTTDQERTELMFFLAPFSSRVVMYHCTSEYPVPFERLFLLEIPKLINMDLWKDVGFSNHGYGIAADVAAYTLGANWIERHFVDDRTLKHSDAAASLECDGLKKLCRDLKAVQKALSHKKEEMTQEEIVQRNKLKNLPHKST